MAVKGFAFTQYNKFTPFEAWIESEGIPIIRDFVVRDLRHVEVRPWARMGGKGAWLVLGSANDQTATTPYVCEIPPGGNLEPEKHMYEEMIFILDGVGATEVWLQEAGIDFMSYLPESRLSQILPLMRKDPRFKLAPAASEADAVSIAVGATLGGKQTACYMESTGIYVSCIQLLVPLITDHLVVTSLGICKQQKVSRRLFWGGDDC